MNIAFITDPLVTTLGAVRPAILLAKELQKGGDAATIITPRSVEQVVSPLRSEGINVKDVGPRFSLISSFPTVDAWLRCLVRPNTIDEINNVHFVVNTSCCIIARANVYYGQGLMTRTLPEVLADSRSIYKYLYRISCRPLTKLEQILAQRFRNCSDSFIANSQFCLSMYQDYGINVKEVINPPLDCNFFKPSTTKPSADYVLTTFGALGKEGNFSVVKAFADAGVNIKAFGDASGVPSVLKRHPKVAILGRVSDKELVDLYTNALYTLFAFSHEPFGYVPVESMACGTPVLTYNKQGPSETVLNGKTGWLSDSNSELLALGLNYWKNGFNGRFRTLCRERSLTFDTRRILVKWNSILNRVGKTT